jgi:outer membrane protein assembly factor BamE (lipoprotein component of BamABCDE complex)
MKKSMNLASLLLAIIFLTSACVSNSGMKKRKKCKGQGNWYNNRNLSAVETAPSNSNTICYEDFLNGSR